MIFGAQAKPFSLDGTQHQEWPMRGQEGPIEQLPIPRLVTILKSGGGTYVSERPGRILETTTVAGQRALVLAAPQYPEGGLSGGHVVVVWNAHGHGYFVSLHLAVGPTGQAFSLAQRVRAAITIARSCKQV